MLNIILISDIVHENSIWEDETIILTGALKCYL